MSKVYTLDGDILELNNFNKIFRKMTNSQTEINICKILMKNPQVIIKFYDIKDNYSFETFL